MSEYVTDAEVRAGTAALKGALDKPEVQLSVVTHPETRARTLTVVVRGKGSESAQDSHPNFDTILERALDGDPEVLDLFDVAHVAGQKFENLSERVTVANGRVYFDGAQINSALEEQIAQFVSEGEDFMPLVNFYEKIETNPNEHSREHLYKFITVNQENETGAFSITPEGDFVAYKGVMKNKDGDGFQSTTSGKAIVDGTVIEGYIPNAVGSVVSMPRDEVVFDPNNHCSSGLHVGTFPYAESFGRNGAMLKVLINPRDVVSVPNDSAEKMRVSRYKVLEIIDAPESTLVTDDEVVTEAPEYDVRLGDLYEDTDSRRAGSTKKVVEINLDEGTVKVESKNALGITRTREVALSRLLSRKYKRVRRGRRG